MIVKDHMASTHVSQIILMVPSAHLPYLRSSPLQPEGRASRRNLAETDRKRTKDAALKARAAEAISQKSCDFLHDWLQGTRRRVARPVQYEFLKHCIAQCPVPLLDTRIHLGLPKDPRPVLVRAAGDSAEMLPV